MESSVDDLDFDKVRKLNVHPNLVSAIEAMTERDIDERASTDQVREILDRQQSLEKVVDKSLTV